MSIELSSDLNQFNIELVKLKNYEQKYVRNKSMPPKKLLQISPSASSLTPSILKPNPTRKQPEAPKPLSVKEDTVRIEQEYSLPMQMYLTINEGRGFDVNSPIKSLSAIDNIYLICRLFWSKEKVKFEATTSWSLNLSFLIKPLLIANMNNNYMIIEAWKNSNGSSLISDTLIGTIKLPLHEFYLKFKDPIELKKLLSEPFNFSQPVIGVNGWISA